MDFRKKIYTLIYMGRRGNDESYIYETVMLVAIVLSLIPLMFMNDHVIFHVIEIVTVTLFIIDYILRWITADFRLRKGKLSFFIYPFTGWAIVDMLSILPGLHVLGGSFKVIRMIRLLRILRLFKIFRYSDKFKLLKRAIRKERSVLMMILAMAVFYIFVSALVMFNAEPHINPHTGEPTFSSFLEALYWATVTLTTVGYGDVTPVTNIGRIICMFSTLFGVIIFALPSGIITASYLSELHRYKNRQQKKNNNAQ
jgi:voltage-gated potassium channel